ncbi:MAG: hypothetical protein FWF90_17655 [Promicromonosporaceae bacterium]|nr:hypothetical protein [Promicromonosporaceae bacterium]
MDSFLGMPIEVGMDRFLIAQVLGLAVIAFDFWSFQMAEQRKYFQRTTISSMFWLAMYVVMGAQEPILIVATFSLLRNCVFTWAFSVDSPRRRMIARRTMYTSLVVAIVAAFLRIPQSNPGTHWIQILLAVGVVAFVIGQYMPGVYLVRITAVFYALTVILTNTPLDVWNPMGILIELNKIIAIAVFFTVLARKKKERARLAALRPVALGLATPA